MWNYFFWSQIGSQIKCCAYWGTILFYTWLFLVFCAVYWAGLLIYSFLVHIVHFSYILVLLLLSLTVEEHLHFWVTIWVICVVKTSALVFIIFGDNLSWPPDFLGFNLFVSSRISCSLVGVKKNVYWFGLCKYFLCEFVWVILLASCSPTVLKWSFNASAMSWSSVIFLFL